MHRGGGGGIIKISYYGCVGRGGGVFLGHSFLIIKWTWEFFSKKFAIWPPSPTLQLRIKEYPNVRRLFEAWRLLEEMRYFFQVNILWSLKSNALI